MTDTAPTAGQEYLPNHPLMRTGDLEEARHRVAQKFCDHRLEVAQPRNASLNVHHNHAAGRHVSINYLQYGADVTIDPGMLGSFYLLQIPLSGRARVRHRGSEVCATRNTATILNPDRETHMDWRADCRKLILQIDKQHLTEVARGLVGTALPGPIRFDAEVDLTKPGGAQLKHMLLSCARAVEHGQLLANGIGGVEMRVEYDLALALLTLQRSNISHIIERSDGRAMPKGIRAAVEFMHANLAEPVTLNDIAQSAGMNVRTLQKGFQRVLGQTPMRVLKNARLDAAHYQLTVQRDRPSVMSVAFANGFSHLGRFSADYKSRFGVSPSQMN